MKQLPSVPIFSRALSRHQPLGVALVLVLSFLVIISGLIIAFFSMVTTEASSAGTTAAAASAKTLSDSATSYVMGTIVDATLGRDPSDTDETHSGPQYAWVWASQPGMIRTYDNKGLPQYVYKLYSADEMKVFGKPPTSSDTAGMPTKWATGGAKDVWTDMNEPIKVSNGSLTDEIFPIVDPRAAEDFRPGNGHKEDSLDADKHKVAGFKVLTKGDPAAGGDLNAPDYDANNNNPAPMPVKWLYVLQDGTMTTARYENNEAVLNGSAVTDKNPIKGRIAFWTDDECAKVNVNTASQGTYWDVPRVFTVADAGSIDRNAPYVDGVPPQPLFNGAGLALCQPAKGEFQRYPGHPATVSLSEIFGFMGTPPAGGGSGSLKPVLPVPTPTTNYYYTPAEVAQIEQYYNLTPRIQPNGSKAGSYVPKAPLTSATALPRYWRLFSSVDELYFDAAAGTSDTIHRVPNVPTTRNGQTTSLITAEMMQKAKFFLTANSSAPEVTLYNTPRVSMWPINDETKIAPWMLDSLATAASTGSTTLKLTPFDKVAQFCATVGPTIDAQQKVGHPFYFTRWNARSQTDDFVRGSRNQVLYKYLQALTALPVPGATGNSTFAAKWGAGSNGATDRDQILTCIFDYIRCVNMQDSTRNPDSTNYKEDSQKDPNTYPYRYTPVSVVSGKQTAGDTDQAGTYFPGGGEVLPINNTDTNTQGFGRYDTIGGVYLLFFGAHAQKWGPEMELAPGLQSVKRYHFTPQLGTVNVPELLADNNASHPHDTHSAGATDAMGVVFMVSFYNPMQGNVGNHQKMIYRVDKLDKLTFQPGDYKRVSDLQPQPLDEPWKGIDSEGKEISTVFPSGVHYNLVEQGDVRTWHGRGIGGTASPVMAFANGLWNLEAVDKQKRCRSNTKTDLDPNNYPFFGYTNQIPLAKGSSSNTDPAFNAKKDDRNYYYPQNFRISQSEDITIEMVPAEAGVRGAAVQKFNVRFPPGVFRIPFVIPYYDGPPMAPDGTKEFELYTKYWGGTNDPNYVKGRYQDPSVGFLFSHRLNYTRGGAGDYNFQPNTDNFILQVDTCVSLEPGNPTKSSYAPFEIDHSVGDQRMYATLREVPSTYFQRNFFYDLANNNLDATAAPQFAHNMMRSVGGSLVYRGVRQPLTIFSGQPSYNNQYNLGKLINSNVSYGRTPDVPRRAGPVATDSSGGNSWIARRDGGPGSWDTGIGLHKDGAYINKPDEGDQNFARYDDPAGPKYRIPYVHKEDYFANNGTYFSPNRQIPSSMMLGSIPTGIQRQRPWETLLFHPPFNDPGNPGLLAPADHYLADLFWMPVVEPYAISQPFSTAGKINMNYQIQPFTYIKRTTGMRALMASMKMATIPNSAITLYKPEFGEDPNAPRLPNDIRFPINLEATMTMFSKRFDIDNDVYRSATEIATVPLVPRDTTDNSLRSIQPTDSYNIINARLNAYWGSGVSINAGHQLTGNNLKDKPYADLYGRLTTKSNAFTVHVRAQALRKANNTPVNKWVAGKDQVVAEYRGSSIIERYIDANDVNLPDFAAILVSGTDQNNNGLKALNIDQYYKFRVVSTKRFAP